MHHQKKCLIIIIIQTIQQTKIKKSRQKNVFHYRVCYPSHKGKVMFSRVVLVYYFIRYGDMHNFPVVYFGKPRPILCTCTWKLLAESNG